MNRRREREQQEAHDALVTILKQKASSNSDEFVFVIKERKDFVTKIQNQETPFDEHGVMPEDNVSCELTVFLQTIGDPAYEHCKEALKKQTFKKYTLAIMENIYPVCKTMQFMINSCRTKYFVKLDEDVILNPDALEIMYSHIRRAPDEVGMICFNLFDVDFNQPIQGICVYNTEHFKGLTVPNTRTSDMDLLEAAYKRKGTRWVSHTDIMGKHGVYYSFDTIYQRYKSMYEKCIGSWNIVTQHLTKKLDEYIRTGDKKHLFAFLGSVHGIINAPKTKDQELKNYTLYNTKELEVFKRLFSDLPKNDFPYIETGCAKNYNSEPIPSTKVRWK
jgi:hypothetical protein